VTTGSPTRQTQPVFINTHTRGPHARAGGPPEELATVRCILEGWRAGGTYLGIAAQLNAEDVPTKRGGHWYAATVRNIVRGVGIGTLTF